MRTYLYAITNLFKYISEKNQFLVSVYKEGSIRTTATCQHESACVTYPETAQLWSQKHRSCSPSSHDLITMLTTFLFGITG